MVAPPPAAPQAWRIDVLRSPWHRPRPPPGGAAGLAGPARQPAGERHRLLAPGTRIANICVGKIYTSVTPRISKTNKFKYVRLWHFTCFEKYELK